MMPLLVQRSEGRASRGLKPTPPQNYLKGVTRDRMPVSATRGQKSAIGFSPIPTFANPGKGT